MCLAWLLISQAQALAEEGVPAPDPTDLDHRYRDDRKDIT